MEMNFIALLKLLLFLLLILLHWGYISFHLVTHMYTFTFTIGVGLIVP
jgi:hypothetical protein